MPVRISITAGGSGVEVVIRVEVRQRREVRVEPGLDAGRRDRLCGSQHGGV
jgi:hypothetical protein